MTTEKTFKTEYITPLACNDCGSEWMDGEKRPCGHDSDAYERTIEGYNYFPSARFEDGERVVTDRQGIIVPDPLTRRVITMQVPEVVYDADEIEAMRTNRLLSNERVVWETPLIKAGLTAASIVLLLMCGYIIGASVVSPDTVLETGVAKWRQK